MRVLLFSLSPRFLSVPSLPISPHSPHAVGGGAATEVRGRLRDGKATGRVKFSIGTCVGDAAFEGAKHA